MQLADIEAIMVIESDVREHPWSRAAFVEHLLHGHVCGQVAEAMDMVVGYFMVAFEKEGCHVVNLAVHPDWRRRGVALAALREIETVARQQDLNPLWLEVHAENVAAQRLYQKAGFRFGGVLRRYYRGEDGYLFQKHLP